MYSKSNTCHTKSLSIITAATVTKSGHFTGPQSQPMPCLTEAVGGPSVEWARGTAHTCWFSRAQCSAAPSRGVCVTGCARHDVNRGSLSHKYIHRTPTGETARPEWLTRMCTSQNRRIELATNFDWVPNHNRTRHTGQMSSQAMP